MRCDAAASALWVTALSTGAVRYREPCMHADWQQLRTPSTLCALPFPAADVMLPGERKQAHLYEPEYVELLQHSMDHNGGLLAQTFEGVPSRCAPLLQVADSRQVDEGGVWCMLKCIGRVEIQQVAASTSSFDQVSVIGSWVDDSPGADAGRFDPAHAAMQTATLRLHAQCVQLMKELDVAQDVVPVPKPAADVRFTWGHESYLPQFEAPLRANVNERYVTLLERGMDCAPAASLQPLHALWGLAEDVDDARARQQLLSFAACADLKRTLRRRAVVCRSTHARLRMAHAALHAKRQQLQAAVAVEQAVQSVRRGSECD